MPFEFDKDKQAAFEHHRPRLLELMQTLSAELHDAQEPYAHRENQQLVATVSEITSILEECGLLEVFRSFLQLSHMHSMQYSPTDWFIASMTSTSTSLIFGKALDEFRGWLIAARN